MSVRIALDTQLVRYIGYPTQRMRQATAMADPSVHVRRPITNSTVTTAPPHASRIGTRQLSQPEWVYVGLSWCWMVPRAAPPAVTAGCGYAGLLATLIICRAVTQPPERRWQPALKMIRNALNKPCHEDNVVGTAANSSYMNESAPVRPQSRQQEVVPVRRLRP